MKKKILAIFLSLCMAMSLLPVTALATEAADENAPSTQAAKTLPAAVNGVITLKEDVNLEQGVSIVNNDLVIDLNGYKITYTGTPTKATAFFNVGESRSLTVRDSKGNGAIIVNEDYCRDMNNADKSFTVRCVQVRAGGTFTLESGTLQNTNTASEATAVIINFGTVNINGGAVKGVTGIINNAPVLANAEWADKVSTCNINGGLIEGTECKSYINKGIYTEVKEGEGWSWGVALFGPGFGADGKQEITYDKVALNMSDGTIRAGQGIGTNASSGRYAGNTITIDGGTIEGVGDGGAAMYLPAIGKTTINDGTIEGEQGIRICAGELTINGGTINGTAALSPDADLVSGGSGGTEGAIVIGKAGNGYVGDIVVNISENATVQNTATDGDVKPAIVVSDKNMALDNEQKINDPSGTATEATFNYSESGITVNVESQNIKGDVVKVSNNTEDKQTEDGGNTSLTLTNANITGNVINQTKEGDVGISGSTITGDVTNKSKGEVVIENHSTITGTVSNEGTESDKGSVAIIDSTVTEAITDADKNNITIVNSTVNGTETDNTGNNVAMIGATPYETLENAITAAKDGDTITLLKDANLNADITIRQNITIDGQDKHKIDAQPKTSHAITVAAPNAALTLKDVTLNITDQKEQTGTYGLNVQYGATLTLDNADVTLAGLSNATISSNPNSAGTEPGKFVLTNGSAITANDIGGNFSNGGTWTIGAGSKVTIDGCASHGFSASAIIVENGATVDIKNVAYRGISINDADGKLEIQSGGVVNVTNAGTADDAATPRDAVYLSDKATEGLIVKAGATLNVTAGKDGNDRIELSEEAVSASKLNGTIIGTVKLPENSASYVVTYVSNNQQITTTIADKDTSIRLLNALPNQGYNHFVGWKSSVDGKTYQPGAEVTITADTTFTAVWTYIPPANPNYRIDIPAAEGGTVTADPAAAKAGAKVTLTATPDEGYAVGTITVTDRFGDAVKVTENADGTYTFTMPNGQVTVKATFVETEEPAPAEPFPDVDENDWFYDEVVYVYENGLMNGVENNQFAPNTATNRAMLATILYRLAGEPAVSGDLPFTDVAAGTWYTDAVLWAAQNGIVNGLGENTFAPMNTLTREQLVTMLYRYAEAEGYDVSAAADLSGYPDAGKVQPYAQEAMSWAVAEGIVEGMDGNLNPAGSATRAQIATILMRFCEGVAK